MPEPKKFDPAEPLEDDEDEQEIQRKVKARLRMDHLLEEAKKKTKKKGMLDI